MNKVRIRFFTFLLLLVAGSGCALKQSGIKEKNAGLAKLFEAYWEDRMKLFPLEATQNGDNRYNDRLTIEFTDSFRDTLRHFYTVYLHKIEQYHPESLNKSDGISYAIFKREMQMQLERLQFTENYIPFNQFWAKPLDWGQLGSGEGNQPFKTRADYLAWMDRAKAFPAWADSAIVYFKKGIITGYVLPKALVVKMIPQMQSLGTTDTSNNVFYGPLRKLPITFSPQERDSIKKGLSAVINQYVLPTYKKLAHFLQTEYLLNARTTTGVRALRQGAAYYNYLIRFWITTNKSADEIYNKGLSEVKRIHTEMARIKDSVGFNGNLKSFFEYMKTSHQFMPYKKPQQVLAAFEAIHQRMDPFLKTLFGSTPKTAFEIRQTEPFRATSASAEYRQGTANGSRPGIFYVPILDATEFNTASGMESLFLHEVIPGHHYQISLQQENEDLPKFRRHAWYGAYGEGWALYCESLGKELGLYKDPYQYMGALGDEIHRAIRLVVDVGIHVKGMTREQAIRYMMDNEAITKEGATAEIERYMAVPAQALSYKIGALKIRELRNKYENELGPKFKISDFHDEFLKDGVMPLDIAERKLNQ